MRGLRAAMTDQPILAEHEDLVAPQAAGAVVGFVGMVRDHDGGPSGDAAGVSAHPSARTGHGRGGSPRSPTQCQRGPRDRGQPPDRRAAHR